MQRDASCSEFRLRDDTCVVQSGPPGQRFACVNPIHIAVDLLPKVHQIRDEWPHTASEVWPEQLCAPGEEHHGTSLTQFVIDGEKSGKFRRRVPTPKGRTVFDDPPATATVREAGPSSSALPMPRVSYPSLDDDQHGADYAV